MVIKDRLNLQKNVLSMLKEGCTLYLETEKKLRLEVKLKETNKIKRERAMKGIKELKEKGILQ